MTETDATTGTDATSEPDAGEQDALDVTEHRLHELPHETVAFERSPVEAAPAPLGQAPADDELAAAIRIAESALDEVTSPDRVGAFVDVVDGGDGVYSLRFTTSTPGHTDWLWTVTMVRLADAEAPTVLECSLMPGEGSLLAPAWVPWAERLAEYRATHDRDGNPLPEGDEAAEGAEDGEPAEPRPERSRSTGRTRTRRRRRRDREAPDAADAAEGGPAAAEPASDGAAEGSPEPPAAPEERGEAQDAARPEKKDGKKGGREKASSKKDGGKKDGGKKAASKKDGAKAASSKRTRAKSAAPADDELPVAPDIREYADDMDDVLDGVEFERTADE